MGGDKPGIPPLGLLGSLVWDNWESPSGLHFCFC